MPVPVTMSPGGRPLHVTIPPGSTIKFSPAFYPEWGYRLALGFAGTVEVQELTVAQARDLIQACAKSQHEDIVNFRASLIVATDTISRMQQGWKIAGQPKKPLAHH